MTNFAYWLEANVSVTCWALFLKVGSGQDAVEFGQSEDSLVSAFSTPQTSAVEKKVVAIVPGVDQGLAAALHDKGVRTIDDLLKNYNETSLAEVQKPWGKSTQKVGKAAEKILRSARALANGKEEVLQQPPIPSSENYVMFDLEGLPPQLDELDKIYLWGLQVFGE